MRRWVWRLVLVGLLAAAGIWIWRTFFPGQEQLVRRQLAKLQKTATIEPNESQFARIANAQRLTTFFTTNAQVTVNLPGRMERTFSGREELLEAAGGARAMLHSLKVEFLDVSLALEPDQQTATLAATVKAIVPGENVPEVEEVKAELTRESGEWLIRKAETVRVLK